MMDLESIDAKDVQQYGETTAKALVQRIDQALETLPEPGQIPTDNSRHLANSHATLRRAAERRIADIDAAAPKPAEPWTAADAERWASGYVEGMRLHEQEQRERGAYVREYINARLRRPAATDTAEVRAAYEAKRAQLEAEALQRIGKPHHKRPGMPDSIQHPQDWRSFKAALTQLVGVSGPTQNFASSFVSAVPADIHAEAEARGVLESPQAYEYRMRNGDDFRAAEDIARMHAGDLGGGLLDGADPDAPKGLPGIERVQGEASLDAWLERMAADPRLRERVVPHVRDVLREAEARGWVVDTGERRGGLPVFRCAGSGLTLHVPDALLPALHDERQAGRS